MNYEKFSHQLATHFSERAEPRGFTAFVHDESELSYFSARVKEQPLSFGEAMGYAPEREHPALDLTRAIYEACYEDGDDVEIFITAGTFPSTSEGVRKLLERAFSEAYGEEEST